MTMAKPLPSVCVVLHGLQPGNRLLQPWRYVTEVARQLRLQGHAVVMIAGPGGPVDVDGVQVRSIRSVRRFWGRANRELEEAISASDPEVILWSVGLTSFLHQAYPHCDGRIQIGLFSSPMYRLGELTRLGIPRLVGDISLTGIHVLGALSPKWILRGRARRSGLSWLVTQTETTRRRVVQAFWEKETRTIPPGTDEAWAVPSHSVAEARSRLGYGPGDFVVLFYGSPSPVRGLPLLVRAVALASQQKPGIKLLILNRRRPPELERETRQISSLILRLGLQEVVKLVDGYLEQDELTGLCSASDLVAFPFLLLPSDAPLSVLEARALGKPILVTRLGCLPELAGAAYSYIAEPNDLSSLVRAMLQAFDEPGLSHATDRRLHLPRSARTWADVGHEWSEFLRDL
jgi:glycosyltransferase involved in cell wall biosynthesis